MGGPPFLDFPLGGMVVGVFVAEMRCGELSMRDWDRLLLASWDILPTCEIRAMIYPILHNCLSYTSLDVPVQTC